MIKKVRFILLVVFMAFIQSSFAQIDLNNIDLQDLIGKVIKVEKGFAPKFYLGNTPIEQINKVADILGLKKNEEVNKLFKTFQTGRTVYKVATYAGSAIIVYGLVRKMDNSIKSQDWETALYSGLGAVGSGLVVKFLTKGASYKAVDIFNGIAARKIIDIFSIAPASNTTGIGIYIKL